MKNFHSFGDKIPEEYEGIDVECWLGDLSIDMTWPFYLDNSNMEPKAIKCDREDKKLVRLIENERTLISTPVGIIMPPCF
jgi:hypothetical protein